METQKTEALTFFNFPIEQYLLILNRRPSEEHDELKTLVQTQIRDTSRREEGIAMAQTMAEYLMEQGEKRGEKRGEERGQTNAKQDAVLKLLHLRFESVPESVTRKIGAMRSLSS